MLEKSLGSNADSLAYDLEDSVAYAQKPRARSQVAAFLNGDRVAKGERAVRINAVGTGFEQDDLEAVTKNLKLACRHISAIMLPKTESADHVDWVVSMIKKHAEPHRQKGADPMRIVALIENSTAMMNLKEIAQSGKGHLDALVFAAEDYCADLGITRSTSRRELLYPRSAILTTARAFGLQALDLVCVNYKEPVVLREECHDGHTLGYDGKQAIHPSQVDIIQRAFSPSEKAVHRAARVIYAYSISEKEGKGAFALDGAMIDAPVLKQAERVIAKARAGGLMIPDVSDTI
ncbi:citrate lyase subunit beta-like protein, partial [Phenoliferia sp. Uapishka_3]